METSVIQGASTPPPPAPKPASTNDIQRAAAAKASAQVTSPETVQQAGKTATPPSKVESTNYQQKPLPASSSIVNTRGEVTGTIINITA